VLSAAGIAPVAAGAIAHPSAAGTLFGRTLLAVRDDPALKGNFEFGDVATQRRLAGMRAGGGGPADRIWPGIGGVGTAGYRVNAPLSRERRHRGLDAIRAGHPL
jgi:hypothetical protein